MRGQRIHQFRESGAVRTSRTRGTPFRQCRAPVAVASMADGLDVAAQTVTDKIRRTCRHRGHGCYLFVDDDGLVYVVGETSSAAHRWAVEHTGWWLGCWTARVTVDAIRDELAERQLSAACE